MAVGDIWLWLRLGCRWLHRRRVIEIDPANLMAFRGGQYSADLLERVRGGDEAALAALFRRYAGPLRRWASGRLPPWARGVSDTQDLVQETLIRAFRRIEGFDPRGPGALQGYLRQALMNRIRDELRRFEHRGDAAPLDDEHPDEAPSPLEQAIGRQATERYEKALARLSSDDRAAIIDRCGSRGAATSRALGSGLRTELRGQLDRFVAGAIIVRLRGGTPIRQR